MRLSDMEFDGFNYESPIQSTIDRMYENINAQFDNGVLRAIAEVGISVDKDELIRALQYDRGQYEKGYADGIAAAEKARPVVRGEWEECDWVEYDGHGECVHYPHKGCVCTNCRHAFKKEFALNPRVNHCPHCGADMRGDGDGET